MSKRKEYCVRADLNPCYIMYIGYVFGRYNVFVTDAQHKHNYSVYGPYQNIGTAENRLLSSANSYKSNSISYWYMSRDILQKTGAFPETERREAKTA